MRWIVYGFVGLVGVAIAGLYAVPKFIDWTGYRSAIEIELREATGFDVSLNGPITAELLPSPRLIVTDLFIQERGATPLRGTVRWLRASFSFPALLQGRMEITGLAIVEPTVIVTGFRLQPRGIEPGKESGSGNGGTSRQSRGIGFRPGGEVEIENGAIEWPGGTRTTGVTGIFQLNKRGGRLSGDFDVTHGGVPFGLTVNVSAFEVGRSFRVKLSARAKDDDALLDLSGRIEMRASGGLEFTGKGVANFSGTEAVLRPWLPRLAPLLAADDVRIEADIAVSDESIVLEELRLESPGGNGTGRIAIGLQGSVGSDLRFRFSRLDIDTLLGQTVSDAGLEGIDAVNRNQPDNSAVPLYDGIDSGLAGVFGFDSEIDISASAVRLNGALIRDTVLRASIVNGTATLEEFSALLPGGSDLSLAGYGFFGDTKPVFEGNLTLRADDLRRLLDWAGVGVPAVAPDRLRSLLFTSGVRYADRRLDFVDADLLLDGVAAELSAAVALRRRPGIGLRLSIDRLNLDAYRLYPVAGPNSATPLLDGAAEKIDGASGAVERRTPKFDAVADLKIRQLIVAGVPIRSVGGRIQYKNGILGTDRLTFGDAGGLAGSMEGAFDLGATGSPGSTTVNARGKDFGAIAAVLGASDGLATLARQFGESNFIAEYERMADTQNLVLSIEGAEGGAAGEIAWRSAGGKTTARFSNGVLRVGSLNIENLSLTASTGAGEPTVLANLSGDVFGGVLSGGFEFDRISRDTPGRGRISIDGIPVDRYVGGLDGPIQAKGTVTLDADVVLNGQAVESFPSGFQIDGRIYGTMALIVSPEPETRVRIARIERLRELLAGQFGSSSNPLRGTFTLLSRGASKLDARIDGLAGAMLSFGGDANLTAGTLSATVTIVEAEQNVPSYRLEVSGPMDSPDLRLTE